MTEFYVVWNPNGHNPVVRHPDRYRATAEAERLARVAPGERFFVLHAVSMSRKPPPVETVNLDGSAFRLEDEIPF
jgi:hypothetical protein